MIIREYTSEDYERLVDLMLELQQHITDLDSLKRQFATREGQQKYVDLLLANQEKDKRKIFVADMDGRVVGFVLGVVKDQGDEVSWTIPSVIGRVEELCVTTEVRGAGIGEQLMDAIEAYFKSQGCTVSILGVFAPNTRAHDFYARRGYTDRYTDVLKVLE